MTYQNSTVSMADITDGTTNTILIGETLPGHLVEGRRAAASGPTSTGRSTSRSSSNGLNYYTYWMSKHPGLVNFVNCDGSIRPVTNQINKIVLNKMMTRNGGETISADETR